MCGGGGGASWRPGPPKFIKKDKHHERVQECSGFKYFTVACWSPIFSFEIMDLPVRSNNVKFTLGTLQKYVHHVK